MKLRTILSGLCGCAITLSCALPLRADSLLDPTAGDLYGPRPIRVGELITVVITDSVSTNQSVTLKSETSNTLNGPTGTGLLGFIPGLGVENKNSSGRSETAQTQSNFQNTITARVVAVEGNILVLEGASRIVLDGKTRVLTFKGKVRRAEVSQGNSVTSEKIADSEVHVEGAQSSPSGNGGFINWLLFPFK